MPPPKYASGAMSLVNDQIKTVVEGVLRVCIGLLPFRKLNKLGFRQVFVL